MKKKNTPPSPPHREKILGKFWHLPAGQTRGVTDVDSPFRLQTGARGGDSEKHRLRAPSTGRASLMPSAARAAAARSRGRWEAGSRRGRMLHDQTHARTNTQLTPGTHEPGSRAPTRASRRPTPLRPPTPCQPRPPRFLRTHRSLRGTIRKCARRTRCILRCPRRHNSPGHAAIPPALPRSVQLRRHQVQRPRRESHAVAGRRARWPNVKPLVPPGRATPAPRRERHGSRPIETGGRARVPDAARAVLRAGPSLGPQGVPGSLQADAKNPQRILV